MAALVDNAHLVRLLPLAEFVMHNDFACALSDKVHSVLLRIFRNFRALLADNHFGRLQDRVHSFHDVLNDRLVVDLILRRRVVCVLPQKEACDWVHLNGLFEYLDRAKNAVSLRDAFLHEFVQLILQRRCRMCGEKEVLNLIHQLLGGVDLPHRCVDDIHLALKLKLLLVQFCKV